MYKFYEVCLAILSAIVVVISVAVCAVLIYAAVTLMGGLA